MSNKPYTVKDLRGKERPQEVCRVCGSKEVHAYEYGNPTMKCVEFLREEISKLKTKLNDNIGEIL